MGCAILKPHWKIKTIIQGTKENCFLFLLTTIFQGMILKKIKKEISLVKWRLYHTVQASHLIISILFSAFKVLILEKNIKMNPFFLGDEGGWAKDSLDFSLIIYFLSSRL